MKWPGTATNPSSKLPSLFCLGKWPNSSVHWSRMIQMCYRSLVLFLLGLGSSQPQQLTPLLNWAWRQGSRPAPKNTAEKKVTKPWCLVAAFILQFVDTPKSLQAAGHAGHQGEELYGTNNMDWPHLVCSLKPGSHWRLHVATSEDLRSFWVCRAEDVVDLSCDALTVSTRLWGTGIYQTGKRIQPHQSHIKAGGWHCPHKKSGVSTCCSLRMANASSFF